MKIQDSLTMTNKFHVVIIISLMLLSCSKHALDEETANRLVCSGCIQNERLLDPREFFTAPGTNVQAYETYLELERKGFLEMKQTDTLGNRTNYEFTWLPPMYHYITDSIPSSDETYYKVLVRMFDYEKVEVLGSVLHDEVDEPYYEIDFVIYGIKSNPFSGLHVEFDYMNKQEEHRKCYVKETNGNWEIDYRNSFDGI